MTLHSTEPPFGAPPPLATFMDAVGFAARRSKRGSRGWLGLAATVGLLVCAALARPVFRPAPALRQAFELQAFELVLAPPILRGLQNPAFASPAYIAAPFALSTATPRDRVLATRCLADTVYYEAALEPIEGRRAVAQVVLNRVRAPGFPKTVCGVVYDGWRNPPGCQFSFTCDGSLARSPAPGPYRAALDVAAQALAGHVEPLAGLATHYHAISVQPAWRANMIRVGRIGAQIFYRWPGAGAFTGRYAGGEQPPPTDALLAEALASKSSAPLLAGSTAADRPSQDDNTRYLNGRRIRSRDEILAMNRWLDENRPIPNRQKTP